MISVPSAPRAHIPSLRVNVSAESSCLANESMGNTTSPMSPMSSNSNTNAADNYSQSNKRPNRHYLVHSHSSRHVHLTDGITPRELAVSIIQAQYHIYHTDLSGYLAGGAMVQDALTTYALGGSPRDLFQIYKKFRPDKERIPPTPTIHITTRNWKDWLGHKSYYHDYLDFFDRALHQMEAKSALQPTTPRQATPGSWSMVPEFLAPLIPGLCAATGPLIHLGYGIEFGSRLAMAEGLAPKKTPSVSILNMIRNDKRLDGMFDAGFQGKLNVVMSSRVSLLKSYLGMWASQVGSVSDALLDLSQTTSLLLFTGTNRFGDEQQLDQNLANVLLATHSARFLVEVLPTEEQKEQLMKAIWMSLVATYVVQGRPKMAASPTVATMPAMSEIAPQEDHRDDDIANVEDNDDESSHSSGGYFDSEISIRPSGRWRPLCQEAIHAEHQFVPKIVRALWWAEMEHGQCGDLFYDLAMRALSEDAASDESSGPGI
ncbi:hypothetical protein BG006_011340 [Podila minutissima]|uniref:Uncharacterized protein n=1 Tax=Podila minutissima TaxID=64525 RepID=A0A9P5SEA2_9FUNG|nr:hypothetical protein BG006_011340 [Podila minutissima]